MQEGIKYKVVQDMDKAILVLHSVAKWLEESGKNPSKWWKPENMNAQFFSQYAEPSEFYVVLANDEPVAAAIFQNNQRNQSWQSVDKNESESALYIHWLCVNRQYACMGLPRIIVEFAGQYAKDNKMNLLRVDTNARELNLRKIYENLGFKLVSVEDEDYRQTAFYQKKV